MIAWEAIDTVLLDMDGTLLDLAYDNTLWNRLLPERYGAARALPVEEAREALFDQMAARRGQLEFYCLDFWADYTGLDVVALHHELAHLISYRPNAREFLTHLANGPHHVVLVTNAHRDSLDVKNRYSGLTQHLDQVVSCHDYQAPKESRGFWEALRRAHAFDPGRTLLIDDNATVLDAAGEYGIAHLLTIAQPDSQRPPRSGLKHPAVHDFRDLIGTDAPARAPEDGGP